MTQSRFATRKASLGRLCADQNFDSAQPLQASTVCLEFGNSSCARLLVRLPAYGAAARHHRRGAHAAFCSVSAASAAATPVSNEGRGSPSKGKALDASKQKANEQPQGTASSLERLPVAVKKGDQLLPYVWDGRRITAMNEAALQDTDLATGRLRNWVMGLQRQIKDAFLPDPRDVTPDYWEWLRWRLTQRFFSSTMQNFSFSALLMATGLGAKKAFAASAAINWLLKDGVSRIVRMSVSTSFGQTFDADLKRMRFITSLIFTACMAGEFATPFWPQHFVALASISSVGRAIGLSAFVATQPAFQAALATGGNLADLTSKNQAQHMVMDMLALGLSAGLTWLCRGMPRGGLLLPAVMYPLCSAGDLTCIWHELKAVQLRTLNRERAEMVIERWMRRGAVPDAAEISQAESLILPSDVWRGLLPLRITPLDRLAPANPEQLRDLLHEYDGEEYVLHVAGRRRAAESSAGAAAAAAGGSGKGGSGGSGGPDGDGGAWRLPLPNWLQGGAGGGQPEVLVSLSDRSTPKDIAKALLQAAYLRKALTDHFSVPQSEVHRNHHHHHKQLHHHSHHQHNPDGPGAGWAANASGPAMPYSPEEQLRLLTQQHHINHHNHHNHHHDHQHHHSPGKDLAPDTGAERDVANRTNRHNGSNHNHHNHQHQRDQVVGVHQLWERRQEAVHQQQQTAAGDGAAGAGEARLLGHTHDHLHWDPRHRMLLHHSHYHTHPVVDSGCCCCLWSSPSSSAAAAAAAAGHGQEADTAQGGLGGGPPSPALGTASLSLSHRHASGSASSSDGGGGGGAGGDSPTQQRQLQRHSQQVSYADGSTPPRLRSASSTAAASSAAAAVGREPAPRWDQIDESAWAVLIGESRREAERNLPRLLKEAEQAGWKLKPFMLNTTERVQFVRL